MSSTKCDGKERARRYRKIKDWTVGGKRNPGAWGGDWIMALGGISEGGISGTWEWSRVLTSKRLPNKEDLWKYKDCCPLAKAAWVALWVKRWKSKWRCSLFRQTCRGDTALSCLHLSCSSEAWKSSLLRERFVLCPDVFYPLDRQTRSVLGGIQMS